MRKRITLFLSSLIALSSCSVERRLYSKGLHVEFRKPLRGSDSHHQIQSPDESEPINNESEEIYSDSTNLVFTPEKREVDEILTKTADDQLVSKAPIVPERSKRSIFDQKMNIPSILSKSTKLLTKPIHSLKEKQIKKPNSTRNYRKFWEVMGGVGIIAGLVGIILLFIFIDNPICLLILQIILAALVLAGLIWLIVALCGLSFEWFWSGR